VNERIIQQLRQFAPDAIGAVEQYRGDLTVTVRKQEIVRICEFLKNDPALAFDMLIDLLGVDMYRPEGRFEVVYNLYSIANKTYLRLKVPVEEDDAVVPTLTGVWPAANWHERETYDMFGIKFAGHPDLRRFYMPEEFEYYPLRKDFPLMGIPDSLTLPRR
jgi:NADH-quinone oxidoreductase subunit C